MAILESLVLQLGFDIKNEEAVRKFSKSVDQARGSLSSFQSVLAGFAGGIGAGFFMNLADAIGGALAAIPKGAVAAGSTIEKLIPGCIDPHL
jgi:hypothetical protein